MSRDRCQLCCELEHLRARLQMCGLTWENILIPCPVMAPRGCRVTCTALRQAAATLISVTSTTAPALPSLLETYLKLFE